MNQSINKIKGQTLPDVELVATESITSTVQGNINNEIRGEQYESLKASIKINGILTPIIVDVETKQIISGNLRHQIALELNIPEVRVVFEELKRANMIMDFYTQHDPQSSECENYINQFTSTIHQLGFEIDTRVFALKINNLCMCSDDVYYAFRILLDNFLKSKFYDISQQLVLKTCYTMEFTSAMQWEINNYSEECKQCIVAIPILLFLMCEDDAEVYEAFVELLNNIYLRRLLV